MTHTSFSSVLAQAIFDKINDAKSSLGVVDVYYGDQNNLPRSPTVVVLPGPKRRQLAGVSAPGGRVENELNVFVDVHVSAVGDESTQRLILDQLSEQVELELHKDVTVGGIIIHGFVHTWDPGIAFFNNSMFRSVRLVFTGITKTYLS